MEGDILPFQYCLNLVDARLEYILKTTGCTDYEFYLTGKGNFRFDVATILPYKGNRKQPKPWHYENLRNYLMFRYKAEVIEGMEADDMLAIRQTEEGSNSVIVSRDKDLRMVEGWHYGYAVGNQPEQTLEYIDRLGYLKLNSKKKLKGGGLKWFFAQCLLGDKTDNIQGLPKWGDIKTAKLLMEVDNEAELYAKTVEAYQTYYDDAEKGYAAFSENATLLWMCTELNEDGTPKMWEDIWKS